MDICGNKKSLMKINSLLQRRSSVRTADKRSPNRIRVDSSRRPTKFARRTARPHIHTQPTMQQLTQAVWAVILVSTMLNTAEAKRKLMIDYEKDL